MFIVNIEYPGTWLELPNREDVSELTSIISSMETTIIDMAITLTMFMDCQQKSYLEHASDNMKDSWERDRQLRMHIEKDYRDGLDDENDFYTNHEYHRAKTEKLYRQEKLNSGEVPRSYKNRFSFIHAHSFLSSADTFYKYLSVLSREKNLENIKVIKQQFEDTFPTLSKIRNSAQHSEDRIRGYGKPADLRKKIKMDLKPIDNGFIKAEGGVLALSNLNGNRLGYTIDDGSYQEFEVSEITLGKVADLFQSLINSFQWSGLTSISPHI